MQNLNPNDPTQKPILRNALTTFDDPFRKAGPDVTVCFDSSESNCSEWANSEALEAKSDSDEVENCAAEDDEDDEGAEDDEDEEDEADETDLDVKMMGTRIV